MTPQAKARILFYRLYQQCHRCFYCVECLSDPAKTITVDHVLPARVVGKKNDYTNLVAACLECNQKKGGKMPSLEERERLKTLNTFADGKEYNAVELETEVINYYEAVLRTPVYISPDIAKKQREIDKYIASTIADKEEII